MKKFKQYDLVVYTDSKGRKYRAMFVKYTPKRAVIVRYGVSMTVKATNLMADK